MTENLTTRDQRILWHPYTQHKTALPPIAIVRGEGALLWDDAGKEYIDAIASWWVNPFGHSNKIIADAVYRQLTTLEHVLFGGFTHQPAVLLGEKLMEILPSNQKKLFFSDNGSTAVEVAIKASLQYYFNRGEKRTVIIAFEDAFHGDTFAAMAASGISLYTQAFSGMFIDVVRVPVPVRGKEQESVEALKNAISGNIAAAFIFEPLVQGAAGMVMYDAAVLGQMIEICRESAVLTIADEVMTGFGKTGKNFACDYLQAQPDMMCLSKALTGGALPMAITTFTDDIFDAFYSDDINKALFHGHTFTANPAGCAAALASIELLQSAEMQRNILRINQKHQAFQEKVKSHPRVKSTRLIGVIFALEVDAERESYYGNLRNKMYQMFIDRGIIMRPIDNIIYILPPYIISDTQLEKIYDTIFSVLDTV